MSRRLMNLLCLSADIGFSDWEDTINTSKAKNDLRHCVYSRYAKSQNHCPVWLVTARPWTWTAFDLSVDIAKSPPSSFGNCRVVIGSRVRAWS